MTQNAPTYFLGYLGTDQRVASSVKSLQQSAKGFNQQQQIIRIVNHMYCIGERERESRSIPLHLIFFTTCVVCYGVSGVFYSDTACAFRLTAPVAWQHAHNDTIQLNWQNKCYLKTFMQNHR